MSDDGDQSDDALQRVGDWLDDYYQWPVLMAVLAFMFWVRTRSWERFIVDGQVYLGGNDAWYHLRQTTYTVQNWPATMPFDPWTYFPYGTIAAQFGTLFDQILATAALIIGLGNPSEHTIRLTLLFAPAVIGALVSIPTYFAGKRLGGRLAGIVAAVVLALLPGTFLGRSLVGSADHNVAEPLFMTVAVVAMMVALASAERELPIWEQVASRDFASLRKPLGWSVLAGIATALYLYVWSPGILLIGIFGVFFALQLCSDYYNDTSPDHVAFVGTVSMLTTGLLLLMPMGSTGFGVTSYSFLQIGIAFAVAFGTAFMAWLARQWDARNVDKTAYPVTVGVIILVAAGVFSILLPSVFNNIIHNLLRFVGFSSGAATRTISEAVPFLNTASRYGVSDFAVVFLDYGLAFFVAILGALWLLWKPTVKKMELRRLGFVAGSIVLVALMFYFPYTMRDIGGFVGVNSQLIGVAVVGLLLAVSAIMDERPAEHLLVVVWGAFITSAAFTQVRFNYYLAVPVAILSGYAAAEAIRIVGTGESTGSRFEDIEWAQVFAVVLVIIVLVVPLIAPFTFPSSRYQSGVSSSTAASVGNNSGPGGITGWDSMLTWMNDNTPEEGNFGGANNADQLPYYGTYSKTDDYQYPDGAYGVMSWWDYGHWITLQAERIPDANPFQQGATTAANYLLAQNESAANGILDNLGSPGEDTRYVAVDWQMASLNAKFSAPTVFADNTSTYEYYGPLYKRTQQGYQQVTNVRTQKYYQSMMVRLYRYHGSHVDAGTTVLDWDRNVPIPGTQAGYYRLYDNSSHNLTRTFDSVEAAKAFVANDSMSNGHPTSQLANPRNANSPAGDVEALKHYRLVGTSSGFAPGNQILRGSQFLNLPTYTKLFERVPGATVHGTGPANTTIRATVSLEAPSVPNSLLGNRTAYTQVAKTGPDGEFTMTLPYSSTGYDNWGPENGHTNVSVRATGPYTFTTGNMTEDAHIVKYNATADVSEAAVLGESDQTVQVDLTRHVVEVPEGAQQNDSTNTTNTSALATPTFSPSTAPSGDLTGDFAGDTTSSTSDATTPSTLAVDPTYARVAA